MRRAAALLVALLAPGLAWGAAVKGTVSLPDAARGRRFPGYWRLENGIVPVTPATGKGDTVVVLEGLKGTAPAAKTVTVDIAGLEAQPRVVVLGPGSVVELKNGDRVNHEMGMPEQSSMMPVERLAPGAVRKQKFTVAGGYVIRDAEFPHVMVSVLIVDTPYFALSDDKGAFSIGGVPEGKGTLKVWSQGRWVHEQPLDTGRAADVAVKVAAPAGKDAAKAEE